MSGGKAEQISQLNLKYKTITYILQITSQLTLRNTLYNSPSHFLLKGVTTLFLLFCSFITFNTVPLEFFKSRVLTLLFLFYMSPHPSPFQWQLVCPIIKDYFNSTLYFSILCNKVVIPNWEMEGMGVWKCVLNVIILYLSIGKEKHIIV